jgi:thymidylate synthase (FAD)
MLVYLLNNGPTNIAENAAGICIGKHLALTSNHKSLEAAISSKHLSVLEHLSITFYITGISRACLTQLTRHRHFSFSVQSQRYSKIDTSNQNWYVKPSSLSNINIDGNTTALELYDYTMTRISETYKDLIEKGVPKEDARMILPNACKVNLILSCNTRAFVEAASKRLCNKAQEEIRELFTKMVDCLKSADVDTIITDLAVPNCMSNIGCQEAKPCHKGYYVQ